MTHNKRVIAEIVFLKWKKVMYSFPKAFRLTLFKQRRQREKKRKR